MDLKLTPSIISALGMGYLSGKNTVELAKEFNLAPATVCRGLRKYGIQPERDDNLFKEVEIGEETKNKIIDEFKSGNTVASIVKDNNLSYYCILKILVDAGLYKKNMVVAPMVSKVIKVGDKIKRILGAEEQKELCNKFVEGPEDKQELALEYGIHIDTVKAILSRNKCLVKRYALEEVITQFCDEFKNKVYNIFDISKVYQLDPSTVKYWLTKRGLLAKPEDGDTSLGDVPMSTADLRIQLRLRNPIMLTRLDELINNPLTDPKVLVIAIKLAWEYAHGRPMDQSLEKGGEEKKDMASKVLSLMNKDVFKK